MGGEPRSNQLKRLRSGDLLIETMSDFSRLSRFFLPKPFSIHPVQLNALHPYLLKIHCLVPRLQFLPSPRHLHLLKAVYFLPHLKLKTRSRTPPAKLDLRFQPETYMSLSLMNPIVNDSTAAEAQQIVKRKSRSRRKRSKIPKPNIEIKRVPHRISKMQHLQK
ncbi:hypothetical protein TNCV_1095841 [Trichonephila clavipes]|nr:hypothetical protein TNCV_1095841 [Trichonephila clavipes]